MPMHNKYSAKSEIMLNLLWPYKPGLIRGEKKKQQNTLRASHAHPVYTHRHSAIVQENGSTEIFASNSEKSGSGHGSHVAASAMGGRTRGHGSHMTNLPILKQENCMSLIAGHDNRVSYAFLHRFWWNPASLVVFCVGGGFEKSRSWLWKKLLMALIKAGWECVGKTATSLTQGTGGLYPSWCC